MRGVVAGMGLALAVVVAGCGAPQAAPAAPTPTPAASLVMEIRQGAPEATRPPVACARPTFRVTPGMSTESTPTGVHRRTVKDGAISTADLLDDPVVPKIRWLSAPPLDEAEVWAALDPAIGRPSPALASAVATMAGVPDEPGDYRAYAGVRVAVRSLTVTCADGAVLKGILMGWTATESGVINCVVPPPSADRLARKVYLTHC